MDSRARAEEAARAAGLKDVDPETVLSYSRYPIPADRSAYVHQAHWREMKAQAAQQAKVTGRPAQLPKIPLPRFLIEMGHEKAMELSLAIAEDVRVAREARFKARAEAQKQRELELWPATEDF